jgi:hypothetical protein
MTTRTVRIVPTAPIVMAGLDPAIHAVPPRTKPGKIAQRRRVDPRVKPGDDGVAVLRRASKGAHPC